MSTRSTRTTPPYLVTNLDDVPGTLIDQIRIDLPLDQAISGIFVIPSETYSDGFHRKTNPLQALIFTNDGVLQVFASEDGKNTRSIWIPFDSVVRVSLKLVLLYGKLEIWSQAGDHILKIQAEYNTVSHPLLTPFLKTLIRNSWKEPILPEPVDEQTAIFSEFARTSFSFYNGIMLEAVQPGEGIKAFVYQPELQKKWLKLFTRRVFPKTLGVITNKQLIFLQEDLSYRAHYEWLFTFIPIHRLLTASCEALDEWQKLTFQVDPGLGNMNISLLIADENLTRWKSLLELADILITVLHISRKSK